MYEIKKEELIRRVQHEIIIMHQAKRVRVLKEFDRRQRLLQEKQIKENLSAATHSSC